MTEEIAKSIQAVRERVVSHRRSLHQIPEVGLELPQTAAYVRKVLIELGCEPQTIGSCGQVVTLGQGTGTLLLRADMDALPVQECTTLPFRSTNGNMHACGHDMHTAVLLGVAEVLKQHEKALPCQVKLVFQPGEELGTGAESLVKAGLLEHPHVDAAAALHVEPTLEVGKCTYGTGVMTSDIYDIFIRVEGKGGHSSQPETTINALAAANGIYHTLSGLVQREVSGFDTAILALCSMHAGSQSSPNIVPEVCEMAGTLRCFDRALGQRLVARVREIVASEAASYRAKATVETLLTPSLTVDEGLAQMLLPALNTVFGQKHVARVGASAGSEDFSYIAQEVPAFFCWVGAGAPGNPPLHNPNLVLDERAMEYGLKVMTELPFVWAEQNNA
ncbi:M20 family metallopeptidase [Flavonifractor sp. An306]|uniref:M20 metallopeptidase family protein n=1 Tax=Flavonifractor sp. An306 TaxID=1965629 RepID=UPI0013A64D11|nr:M20 family metallopeptidase [Flavonifractor sp. An306]